MQRAPQYELRARQSAMVQLTAVAIARSAVYVHGCLVAHIHGEQDPFAIRVASGNVGMNGIERPSAEAFALATGVDHEAAQGDGAIGEWVVANGGGASIDAHVTDHDVVDDQGQGLATGARRHVGQRIGDAAHEGQLIFVHAQGQDPGAYVGIDGEDSKGAIHAAIMGPV